MKKFLSLVLALVMTMSLVTISAGAKDFTDADKVTYTEAVDVLSAVKVIDGYTDGAFKPTNQLNRGQAAKILCNMILGPTTASALKADAAPFKDVPADSTFAAYIAYCAKEGIIDGYTDGTFRPSAPLTGYAFMKLLLGALGYDKDIEGYNQPNWSINVAKRALAIGLDKGLVENFDGTKIVTREEACLYALNTLKADLVEYGSKTTVNVNGATVTVAGNDAKPMTWDTGVKNDGNIGKADGFIQFAEQYLGDLKLNKGADDDFGRPANEWRLKAEKIGTYPKTPDLTYTKSVKSGDIYKDLGLGSTIAAKAVTVYVNGAEKTAAEIDIKKGSETAIGDATGSKGNGVLTEVFYDDDADTIIITQILTYIGEINKTVKATDKKDAYVEVITTVEANGKKPAGASGTEKFETNEVFDDEAKVLYTFSERNNGEIKSVVLAESVNGTVTQVKNKTNDLDNSGLTIAGDEKKASLTLAQGVLGAISVDQDYTVYLDSYGYVISVSEEDYKDYALVLDIEGTSQGGFNTNRAKLVFTDGTTAVVSLAKDYLSKGIAKNEIVTFKADNGVYTLKEVKLTQKAENVTAFKLENDKASITTGATAPSKATVYGNSKTMYVVKNVADNNYSAYTGAKSAPTVTGNAVAGKAVSAYWFCKSGDIVTTMFVIPQDDSQVTDENNNLLFLAKESASDLIHNSTGDYYEYQAVVNGEIKTVKVDWNVKLDGAVQSTAASAKLNGLFSKYSVDKDGIITSVTSYATTGTGKIAGYGVGSNRNSAEYTVTVYGNKDKVITTAKNTGVWTVDDNAKFYEIDKDGNVTTGSYGSVTKDDNDRLYYVLDDGMVIYMFVETVPETDVEDYDIPDGDNFKVASSKVYSTGYATVKLTVDRPAYLTTAAALNYSFDVKVNGEDYGTMAGNVAAGDEVGTVIWSNDGTGAQGDYKLQPIASNDVITIENFQFTNLLAQTYVVKYFNSANEELKVDTATDTGNPLAIATTVTATSAGAAVAIDFSADYAAGNTYSVTKVENATATLTSNSYTTAAAAGDEQTTAVSALKVTGKEDYVKIYLDTTNVVEKTTVTFTGMAATKLSVIDATKFGAPHADKDHTIAVTPAAATEYAKGANATITVTLSAAHSTAGKALRVKIDKLGFDHIYTATAFNGTATVSVPMTAPITITKDDIVLEELPALTITNIAWTPTSVVVTFSEKVSSVAGAFAEDTFADTSADVAGVTIDTVDETKAVITIEDGLLAAGDTLALTVGSAKAKAEPTNTLSVATGIDGIKLNADGTGVLANV